MNLRQYDITFTFKFDGQNLLIIINTLAQTIFYMACIIVACTNFQELAIILSDLESLKIF